MASSQYRFLTGKTLVNAVVVVALFCVLHYVMIMKNSIPCNKQTTEQKQFLPVASNHINRSEKIPQQMLGQCSQEIRQSYTAQKCKDLKDKRFSRTPLFIVDDEHKIAFCDIAKSASTTLKTLLMISTSKGRKLPFPVKAEPHNAKQQSMRGIRRIPYGPKLKNYTKFLVVRNPYERLVSAYREKFMPYRHPIDTYYRAVKSQMLKAIGKTPDDQMTFPDLVKIIVDKYSFRNDFHLESYGHLCNPCAIKYDYLLRSETLSTDINNILPFIDQPYEVYRNATGNISKKLKGNSKFGKYLEFLKEISPSDMKKLNEFYVFENTLFGYGIDGDSYTYCSIESSSGQSCC